MKKKMTHVSIMLDQALKNKLRAIAKTERRSISNLLTLFLERGVKSRNS